jgi:UDP-N-acetylglucosamine--N-acetylmuramyl-(pentapeptide) pyrophosphoryl-undecaprenol N-acetylglucosamine transferase
MSTITKALFACGGTGGHVFPAVAIAEVLHSSFGVKVSFAGRAESMESRILKDHTFYAIKAVPLKRGKLIENLSLPFTLPRSILSGLNAVSQSNADVVIGTGGYVSLPVLIGAWLKRVPVYIQEQNSVAGVANKIAARFAKKVFVPSESVCKQLGIDKTEVTGNPIRGFDTSVIPVVPEEYQNSGTKKIVLVLGGSQGAKGINEKLYDSLDRIENQDKYIVIWQVGAGNVSEYETKTAHCKNVLVKGFIDSVMGCMYHADLLVSRAGASTLAEVLVLNKPSILVPFPFATANHQEHNAREVENVGAAIVELESDANDLVNKIEKLINENDKLLAMKEATKILAKPDAAQTIANRIMTMENSL